MNIHKFIIYIAAAFLGISVIFGAAGTGAAAAAARAENAETREYTPAGFTRQRCPVRIWATASMRSYCLMK